MKMDGNQPIRGNNNVLLGGCVLGVGERFHFHLTYSQRGDVENILLMSSLQISMATEGPAGTQNVSGSWIPPLLPPLSSSNSTGMNQILSPSAEAYYPNLNGNTPEAGKCQSNSQKRGLTCWPECWGMSEMLLNGVGILEVGELPRGLISVPTSLC